MSHSTRSNLTIAVVVASALVGGVSLSAGYIVGSLVHPKQVSFDERWPSRPIAQLDPNLTKDFIQRFPG
jgi:hypothetical protein